MHVKESVKDFVHDVKRRFSHHKHKRGESSASAGTTDTFDTSTTSTSHWSSGTDGTAYSTAHSHPATPAGSMRGMQGRSLPNTPERGHLIPFAPSQRVRTPSTPSRKHNVLHKLRRPQSGSVRSRTKSLSGLFGSKEDKDHPGLVPSALTLMHGGLAQVGRDHERQVVANEESQPSEAADAGIQSPQVIISGAEPESDSSVVAPVLGREMPDVGGRVDDEGGSTHDDRQRDSANVDAKEDAKGVSAVVEEEEYGDVIYVHSEVDGAFAESAIGEGDSQTLPEPMGGHEEAVHDVHDGDDDAHLSCPTVDLSPETTPQADIHSDAEETASQSHSDVSETLVSTATSPSYQESDDKHSHPAVNSDSDEQSKSAVVTDELISSDQTSGALSQSTPSIVAAMSNVDEHIPGPDPFLADSDEDTSGSAEGPSQQEEIALPSPNMSKPTPPLPSIPRIRSPPMSTTPLPRPQPTSSPVPGPALPSSPPPVYIPRLTAPSMFLPVPNTDPLSALLTKHVPPERRPRRDVVGEYAGRDIHEMVMSNSWRALAKMARDKIVKSDPEDLARILDLWSLRLSSLARLRLTNQASAECTNLFAVLNAVPPQPPPTVPGIAAVEASVASMSPATNMKALPLSPASTLSQLPIPHATPTTPTHKPFSLADPSAHSGHSAPAMTAVVHPFELTVFHARVHYWSGDVLGYVDALSGILAMCKERARVEGWRVGAIRRVKEDRRHERMRLRRQHGNEHEEREDDEEEEETGQEEEGNQAEERTNDEEEEEILATAEANLSMWLERTARVCLILASQLVEMKDYQAAITLLTPLCTRRDPRSNRTFLSPALYSALGRIYLIAGNVPKATECFETVISCSASHNEIGRETLAMNDVLLSAALGDWEKAEQALRGIVQSEPENFTAMNNLAVTLFSQGKITEGIDLLEEALQISPSSVVVAEPLLFNLSTLYELRSATAIDKKRELLIEVAKWSGDGLKTTCLKMPSN